MPYPFTPESKIGINDFEEGEISVCNHTPKGTFHTLYNTADYGKLRVIPLIFTMAII